jgi:hypothetical protein
MLATLPFSGRLGRGPTAGVGGSSRLGPSRPGPRSHLRPAWAGATKFVATEHRREESDRLVLFRYCILVIME